MNAERLFDALGDPVRRKLVEALADRGPRTATQLAEQYPITRQGILKHLHVLQDAGLVTVLPVGREKRFHLSTAPLGDAERWIRTIGSKWDNRLLRLKTMLEEQPDPP